MLIFCILYKQYDLCYTLTSYDQPFLQLQTQEASLENRRYCGIRVRSTGIPSVPISVSLKSLHRRLKSSALRSTPSSIFALSPESKWSTLTRNLAIRRRLYESHEEPPSGRNSKDSKSSGSLLPSRISGALSEISKKQFGKLEWKSRFTHVMK